jgi:hypothetical protein
MTLSREDWERKAEVHQNHVGPFVQRRRERRSRGLKHPVEDFIWQYYGLRGSRLLSWHPGHRVRLLDADAETFSEKEGYTGDTHARWLDVEQVLSKRRQGVTWIRNLQEKVEARPPVFSCLGLHEWAMVYELEDIRHAQLPLRLSHAETRKLVESFPLQCTHYDAFRFFSQSARPLNATDLSEGNRVAHEQPGCLHVNMDLFKWCMKLQPLVSSELTRKCFDLACTAREIDMRAGPYDLGDFGGPPVKIETPAGRAEYVALQQEIADRGRPLRQELIQALQRLG